MVVLHGGHRLGVELRLHVWSRDFLFGAGEAGCFPNLTKAFSTWLPKRERTRAQALMWMGARWGGAFTPLLVVMRHGVRELAHGVSAFRHAGRGLGDRLLLWFRDNPRDHKGVNAAELALLKENEQNVAGPRRRAVARARRRARPCGCCGRNISA